MQHQIPTGILQPTPLITHHPTTCPPQPRTGLRSLHPDLGAARWWGRSVRLSVPLDETVLVFRSAVPHQGPPRSAPTASGRAGPDLGEAGRGFPRSSSLGFTGSLQPVSGLFPPIIWPLTSGGTCAHRCPKWGGRSPEEQGAPVSPHCQGKPLGPREFAGKLSCVRAGNGLPLVQPRGGPCLAGRWPGSQRRPLGEGVQGSGVRET